MIETERVKIHISQLPTGWVPTSVDGNFCYVLALKGQGWRLRKMLVEREKS